MPAPFPPPIIPRRESKNRSPQPTEGPVEFYEENGVYTLRIEMPGFDAEDISVTWHDGTVCVSTSFSRGSNQSRTYHRAFWTPKEIDPDTISAHYHSGILSITLPIDEEDAPYGKEIEIKE